MTAQDLTPEEAVVVEAFGIHHEIDAPPVPRYRYTLVIEGNTHDEIEQELLFQTRGGYLLDSDYYKRDSFHVLGGRKTSTLVEQNPGMTPEQYQQEQYQQELDAWWERRKVARRG